MIIAPVPRSMMARKPKHGSPCNRCGACCYASLCDLGASVHNRRVGPCPSLQITDGLSSCGLVETSTGSLREAAKLLVNSGQGCDMKLSTEPRDVAYTNRLNELDHINSASLAAARRLWGMKEQP
jgi:hypothetical protein